MCKSLKISISNIWHQNNTFYTIHGINGYLEFHCIQSVLNFRTCLIFGKGIRISKVVDKYALHEKFDSINIICFARITLTMLQIIWNESLNNILSTERAIRRAEFKYIWPFGLTCDFFNTTPHDFDRCNLLRELSKLTASCDVQIWWK